MTMLHEVPTKAALLILSAGVLGCGLSASYHLSRPRPPAISQEDARLRDQWHVLRNATPERISRLEDELSMARAALPAAATFDDWLSRLSANWTVLASATERYPGLVVRRYALAYNHPTLRSWPDIVGTVKILCMEPGLTLDSLSLAAAPGGADAFVQAQLTLTARLRP
jgi:hypothetical protein